MFKIKLWQCNGDIPNGPYLIWLKVPGNVIYVTIFPELPYNYQSNLKVYWQEDLGQTQQTQPSVNAFKSRLYIN